MKIAVANAKGETGRTTRAAASAVALSHKACCAAYADCDVEELSGYLFLKPATSKRQVPR